MKAQAVARVAGAGVLIAAGANAEVAFKVSYPLLIYGVIDAIAHFAKCSLCRAIPTANPPIPLDCFPSYQADSRR